MSRYFRPEGSVTISSLSRPCVARAGGAQPRARCPCARGAAPARTPRHTALSPRPQKPPERRRTAQRSQAARVPATSVHVSASAQLRHAASRTWRRHGMDSSGDGSAAEACARARTTRCACGLRGAAACESASAARAPQARHAPLAGARCAWRKHAGAVNANAAIAARWARSERGVDRVLKQCRVFKLRCQRYAAATLWHRGTW